MKRPGHSAKLYRPRLRYLAVTVKTSLAVRSAPASNVCSGKCQCLLRKSLKLLTSNNIALGAGRGNAGCRKRIAESMRPAIFLEYDAVLVVEKAKMMMIFRCSQQERF